MTTLTPNFFQKGIVEFNGDTTTPNTITVNESKIQVKTPTNTFTLNDAGYTINALTSTWTDTHQTVVNTKALRTPPLSNPQILAVQKAVLVVNDNTTPTASIGIEADNSGGSGTYFGMNLYNDNDQDFTITSTMPYQGSVVFNQEGVGATTTQTKIKQGTVTINNTANTNSNTLTSTSSAITNGTNTLTLSVSGINTTGDLIIEADTTQIANNDLIVYSSALPFESTRVKYNEIQSINALKQNIISPASVFLNDTTVVQQATLNSQKLRLLTSGLTNDITSDKMSIIKPATSSISEYGTDGMSLTGLFGAESRSGGFNLSTGLTTTNTTTKASGTLNESFVSLDSNITNVALGNKTTLNATGLTCLNKVTPSTTSSLSSTALNVGITGSTVTVNSSGVSSTNILNLNSATQIDTNCAVRVLAVPPSSAGRSILSNSQLVVQNVVSTLQNTIASTSSAITNGTKTITMTVDGLSSTGAMSLGTATVNLTTGSTGITQTYPSNTTALATTQYVTTAISSIPATATPALSAVLSAGNTANNSVVLSDAVITNTISPVQIGISNVGGTIQSLLNKDSLGFTTPGDVFSTDATDLNMANTGGTISSALTKNSFTLTDSTGATARTVTLSNPTIGDPTILLNSVNETTELNNKQINIYNLSTNTQSYLTRTQLQLTSTTTDATMTKDDLIMTEAVVLPAVPAINTINRTGMTLSNSLAKAVYDTTGLIISNLANTVSNTISKFGSSLIDTGKNTYYNLDGLNIQKIVGPITSIFGAQPDVINISSTDSSLSTSNNIQIAADYIYLTDETTFTNSITSDDIQISNGTLKTIYNSNSITSTDNLTINSAATKLLKIGSGSATENVEIATQAGRSVVLHLGDGINNLVGSGVHINNGNNSVGNTQINNGSGQTGTINIGNATSGTTTTNIIGTTNIGNSGSTTTTIGIQSSTINMRGGVNINNSATGGYSGTNIGINGSVTAINGTTNINISGGGGTTIGTTNSGTNTIRGSIVNMTGTTNNITGITNINTTGDATTTIGGTGTGVITIGTATTTSTNLVGTQVNLTNPRINQPITMLYSTIQPAIGIAGLSQIGGLETYRNNGGGNGFFTTTGTTRQVYAFINSIPTGRYIVNSSLVMNTNVVSTTVSMRTVYNSNPVGFPQPLTLNQTLTLADTPASQAIEIEGLKPNAVNKYSLNQVVVMDISSAIGNQVGLAITFGTANVGVLNGFSLYLNLTISRIS